ncbi:MAG TPA: hypothetical protein VKA38_16460 [Draconibacterium sp.]|nr:hypothetical protein [Draconibacterium sp.]
MPYRRLPTTDKARLRALDAALSIASKVSLKKIALSQQILEELQNVKTTFENALKQYEADLSVQTKKSKDYKIVFDKAYLYVSHFIRVVFMTIERGELKEELLPYYGLEEFDGKVPVINSEQELLEWGNKIILGEQKRLQKGGSPIYNPSIALVKVKVENFNEAAVFQHNLKKNTARSHEKLKTLRKSTNDFICRMWNEIENNIQSDSPKHHRQLTQEYGLVYVFRRNEKKKLKSEDLQRDLLFEF